MANAVTYDISKTEAMLFSKSHRQRLIKQIQETKIKIGNEKIGFSKEATRWLGVRLDSQLKFTSHINERLRRARIAEVQIKSLTRTYGLAPKLVRQIQIAVCCKIYSIIWSRTLVERPKKPQADNPANTKSTGPINYRNVPQYHCTPAAM